MPKRVSDFPHKPGENPFIVARGGFYRRWLQMINDLDFFEEIVMSLTSTIDEKWVPIWREAGKKFEDLGDSEECKGNKKEALDNKKESAIVVMKKDDATPMKKDPALKKGTNAMKKGTNAMKKDK